MIDQSFLAKLKIGIDAYIMRSQRTNLGHQFEYREVAKKIKKIIKRSEPKINSEIEIKKIIKKSQK